MSFIHEAYIIVNCQLACTIQDNHLCIRLMNRIASYKRCRHVVGHIEEDAMPARNLRLSTLEELHIGNLNLQTIEVCARGPHMWSIIANGGTNIAHNLDISCEQANLSPHHQLI